MTTWSLNEQKYFQGSPLYWQYLNIFFTNPNSNNEPFEIDFLDGSGTYGLQVWINQTYVIYRTVLYAFLPMVINQGRIFENDYGSLFDPVNNPCFDSVFGGNSF
uniref:Uncharacterized protein n=1 Tax=Panagrolaimus davidi TaxID=227884 RepID=A0A914Q6G5_9BILA